MTEEEINNILKVRELKSNEYRKNFFIYLENEFDFKFPFDETIIVKSLNLKINELSEAIKPNDPLTIFKPVLQKSYGFCLWPPNEEPSIILNPFLEEKAGRYVIMHEICHILFPKISTIYYSSDDFIKYEIKEEIIDSIVDHIMIPHPLLYKILSSFSIFYSVDIFKIPIVKIFLKAIRLIEDRHVFFIYGNSNKIHYVSFFFPNLNILKSNYHFDPKYLDQEIPKENDDAVFLSIHDKQYVFSSPIPSFYLRDFYSDINFSDIIVNFRREANKTSRNSFEFIDFLGELSFDLDFNFFNERYHSFNVSSLRFRDQQYCFFGYYFKDYYEYYYHIPDSYFLIGLSNHDRKYSSGRLKYLDSFLIDDSSISKNKRVSPSNLINDTIKRNSLFRKNYISYLKQIENLYLNKKLPLNIQLVR
jgi:hypothetical protein